MSFDIYPPASTGLTTSDLVTEPQWTLLSSTTGSGVSSLTISSIPQTYRVLRVFWHAQNPTDTGTWRLLFNNTESTYFHWGKLIQGTAWQASRANSASGLIGTPSCDNGYPGWGFCDIYNYANTETEKIYFVDSMGRGGGSDPRNLSVQGLFFGAAESITSVVLRHSSLTNFSTETPGGFRIYGAK
jgi:hypothetical protein